MRSTRRKQPTGDHRAFEQLEPRTFLAAVAWDGGPSGTGTSWHEAVNWVGDVLPATNDDVTIGTGAATVFSIGALTLHSLNSSVPLSITGGSLSVTDGATVTAQVQLNGGALGGSWSLSSLVATANPANMLSAATINGDITLSADNAFISVIAGLTVNGLVSMQGDGAVISFNGGNQTFAGNADVEFSGFTGLRSFSADNDAVLTLAPTVSFMGELGRITSGLVAGSGSVINQGLIWANTDFGTLRVNPSIFTNLGILRATSFGELRISAGNWTNSGTISVNNGTVGLGGTFESAAGIGTFNRTGGFITIDGTIMNTGGTLTLSAATGSWQFNNGQIIGGNVNLTGGASLTSYAAVSGRIAQATITGNLSWLISNFDMELDGVTLNGSLTVSGLSTVSVKNSLTLNGTLSINGDDTVVKWIGGAQTLSGSATILLRHANCYFWAETPLTIPATTSIYGYGHIYGLITSAASITCDTFGGTLIIAMGTFQNDGAISVMPGARLDIGDVVPGVSAFTNHGSILATGSATIAIGPTSTSGPITFNNSGSVKTDNNARLNVGNQLVFNQITINNGAGGVIEAAGASTLQLGTPIALTNPILNNAVGGIIKATGTGLIIVQTPTTTAQLGDLRASGGTVKLLSPLDNTGATLTQNATSGSWTISGAKVTGGTLAFSKSASFIFDNSTANTLDAVTVTGPWSLSTSGARLQILNGLTLTGTLALTGSDAALSFNGGPQSLSGSGTIILAGSGGGQSLSADAGATLTIGSSITIVGSTTGGQLRSGYLFGGSGSIINSGTISGNLTINATAFTNAGTVEAAAGATLHIQGAVTNYSAGTLAGGTWRISGTSTLDFSPGSITSNQAILILDGPKSTCSALSSLTSNSGTLQLSSGRNLSVTGNFTNAGTLDLGATSTLNINGSFNQSALGTLRVHITAAAHSFLTANSSASLDGTINATWTNYLPPIGTRTPIIKSPVVTGTFSANQATSLSPSRIQSVAYTPSAAELVISALPFTNKR